MFGLIALSDPNRASERTSGILEAFVTAIRARGDRGEQLGAVLMPRAWSNTWPRPHRYKLLSKAGQCRN